MTSRFRIALLFAPLALAGCDARPAAGPIGYRPSERLAKDLAEKPKLRGLVQKALASRFGDDVRHIRVPEDSGLRDDGAFLGKYVRTGETREPVAEVDPKTGAKTPVEGGYAIYRRNCLHCHGVSGAGDGPTAEYLYPRPRDYRPGIFKFTSTNPVNAKPSRADLRKTLLYGIHGTSMPAFEAILTPSEIEQVIDYTTFLAMRGEVEKILIDEAAINEAAYWLATLVTLRGVDAIAKVTSSWKEAEAGVVNPSTPRVASTPRSIKRGRDLFLGLNKEGPKLECVSCHGAAARGNGPAFIDPPIFNQVVFRRYPLDQAIESYFLAEKEKSAEADSRASQGPTPAPADHKAAVMAVANFLKDNPAVLSQLRKERGLLPNVSDKDLAERLAAEAGGEAPKAEKADKIETITVAESALELLPTLDDPSFRALLVSKMELWSKSLDEWGDPLRPANLLDGTYKGGRRPIDLYWRIAKGINGAKMPAHAGLLTDDQIWDVVNFILALPTDPALLPESLPKPGGGAHSVASSH